MKILVKKVDTASEEVIVDFSCQYGEAEAFWGTKPIPKANTEHDVELDITDELVWGQDVKLSKDKKFSISMQNEDILITGILEKTYKGGLVDFRFGQGIIQLELMGKNLPTGQYVTVKTSMLEIYEALQ